MKTLSTYEIERKKKKISKKSHPFYYHLYPRKRSKKNWFDLFVYIHHPIFAGKKGNALNLKGSCNLY